ncbi:MAG: hypothetical protein J0H60_00755, partial [Rhizobiales bacterium]|nr:hypothetical protein [Hyphomicrobiales bacterium]
MNRSYGLALFSSTLVRFCSTLALCTAVSAPALADGAGGPPKGIDKIKTVVVIFAENRAFDNLYG